MEQTSETDLIRHILDGNPESFSVLLRRYQRPVYSLIRQIVSCREDAEELTQDVFVKVFTKLGSFRGASGFSTWLYRIAYNTAISFARKRKFVSPVIDDRMLGNIPDEAVDEWLDQEDDEALMQSMEAAIERLTPADRALISLYYSEERSVGEVSDITGFSPENVKVRLFRIRKKIVFLMNQSDHE